MTGEVWVSRVRSNHELGNKLGIREKFFGHDWEPPTHIVPDMPKDMSVNMNRAGRGETLKREEFPEASFVFDEKRWKRTEDFFWAGGFMAVKGKLAQILSKFDLGPGGGLIPYPIYHEDKITPYGEQDAFLVNFGAGAKDCFLPQESEPNKIVQVRTLDRDGYEMWRPKFDLLDGQIAVSGSALSGADLWIEPKLDEVLFVSGALVEALPAKVKRYFELSKCRVVA